MTDDSMSLALAKCSEVELNAWLRAKAALRRIEVALVDKYAPEKYDNADSRSGSATEDSFCFPSERIPREKHIPEWRPRTILLPHEICP